MLLAGTDPKAREGNFSEYAGNASSLINAHFMKPNLAKTRFPPVLDRYSHTIAAPVATMKYNLSVSSRIGTNITPTSKMLYLDMKEKCVKVIKKLDSANSFEANSEYL